MRKRFMIYDLRFKKCHSQRSSPMENEVKNLILKIILESRSFILQWRIQDDKKNLGKKLQRGVTLIELLLYMGIFSTLLMVLVQLFGTIVNVNLEAQATSAVSQDGRYLLNRLTYDVRRASVITSPAVGVANSGSTLILTIGGVSYTYTLSGNNLTLNDGSGAQQLNSEGTTVSNLLFTTLKSTNATGTVDSTVTISFKLTSTTIRQGNRPEVENFQTTVGTR